MVASEAREFRTERVAEARAHADALIARAEAIRGATARFVDVLEERTPRDSLSREDFESHFCVIDDGPSFAVFYDGLVVLSAIA